MNHTLQGLTGHSMRQGLALLFLCLALSGCELLTSTDKLKSEANSALSARNFASAAQLAHKWAEKTPDQHEAYFVLAQAHAQAGDKNAALMALEQAINKGLKDDVQIESNTNLDPIKSMIAYQALMNKHFPGLQAIQQEQHEESKNDGDNEVSITEKDGQQTLRAGDVLIQMPVNK